MLCIGHERARPFACLTWDPVRGPYKPSIRMHPWYMKRGSCFKRETQTLIDTQHADDDWERVHANGFTE
jgi:hypothetical protein